jgi:CDP-glucose 4,6-dehydratase
MDFKGKNILITGINGFLGSLCAEKFLEEGAHVIGLVKDRNKKTKPHILDRCSIVYGDIRDKEVFPYILSKYEVDFVLHLAAQAIVKICNNEPYTAYMSNMVGTLNLMEALRTVKNGPQKTIVITSDKAYGPSASLPYMETTELVVADSYCTSKACQDMLARSYAMTYDIPVVIVRAGNLYGPGDLNTSRLIPRSIIRMLTGKSPVLYSTVAEFTREFIYVENAFNAFKVLLEFGVSSEAYNIGGTKPHKIVDVIEMIRNKINPDIKVELLEKDFYEIKEQYLCSDKLKGLGWSEDVGLSEGLDKSISWYRDYVSRGGVVCL